MRPPWFQPTRDRKVLAPPFDQDCLGFKSGVLKLAPTVTDPRRGDRGVDADYLVDPDYLRPGLAAAGPLPAAVRLVRVLLRRLSAQPHEHDGAVLGGTRGLIRRRALEAVGSRNEWCITEDAELSLQLLCAGQPATGPTGGASCRGPSTRSCVINSVYWRAGGGSCGAPGARRHGRREAQRWAGSGGGQEAVGVPNGYGTGARSAWWTAHQASRPALVVRGGV
jgi:hypothetical protein